MQKQNVSFHSLKQNVSFQSLARSNVGLTNINWFMKSAYMYSYSGQYDDVILTGDLIPIMKVQIINKEIKLKHKYSDILCTITMNALWLWHACVRDQSLDKGCCTQHVDKHKNLILDTRGRRHDVFYI